MQEPLSKCCNAPVGVKYDPEQANYDWDGSYFKICSECGETLSEDDVDFTN